MPLPLPLSVEALVVAEVFSDRFQFDLPWYQRAYAWQVEHAVQLLQDVIDALAEGAETGAPEDVWYQFGLIVLAKPTKAPDAAIVDGQQRLITLTILIAAMRDLTTDAKLKAVLDACIWRDKAHALLRMEPRDTVDRVLLAYVQEPGATLREPDTEEAEAFNSAEANIIANRNALVEALRKVKPVELPGFANFLLRRCYLLVQSVRDADMAKQIFVKSQERGLNLAPTDITKVNILSCVPAADRHDCSVLWDYWATELGDKATDRLFRIMRDVKLRRRAKALLDEDLEKHYGIEKDAARFVRDEFCPAADMFSRMRKLTLGNGPRQELHDDPRYGAINRRLQYLSWTRHRGWTAPALYWLRTNGHDPAAGEQFFLRLERFAFVHLLRHTPAHERDKVYWRTMDAIDDGTVLRDNGPLALTKQDIRLAVAELSTENFFGKSYKTQVLLRLNGSIKGDGLVERVPTASVEHILPRTPPPKSQWRQLFGGKKTTSSYASRLGNLTLLTGLENTAAGRKDIADKSVIYAGSAFEISRQLGGRNSWTAKDIEARSKQLIDLLLDSWRLKA